MPKSKHVFSTRLTNIDSDTFYKNYTVVRMARYGMSDEAICRRSGLTHGQVSSRIRLYGLGGQRRAVRHGWATEGQEITELAMGYSGHEQISDTKKYDKLRNKILKARRENRTTL